MAINTAFRKITGLGRWLLLPALCFFSAVRANDADANAKIKEAYDLELKKSYYDAAKKYLDAEFEADSPVLRANSLKKAAENWRRCELIYREFEAIEKILSRYPGDPDAVKLVDRMYEIGDEFYGGKREPSFWALRFIPWLLERDKTAEVYAKAIERAPFSPQASSARLRLAMNLIDNGKTDDAVKQLKALVKDYPASKEHKYAYLLLGEIYFDRAKRGDGDGRNNQESLAYFREFEQKYPNSPELDWVRKTRLKSMDIQAERLLNLAQFYQRTGKEETAGRYLADVVRTYPASRSAAKSEAMLVELDKSYVPSRVLPPVEQREQTFMAFPIPEEPKILLVVPENSDGKYLLPIYDLKSGTVKSTEVKK